MNSFKTIAAAAALVAAGASVSNAQNRLHFTGSTAYRGSTVNAIHHIFDSGSLTYAYTGSSETGANAGVYSGTISSVPYIIKTYWTGSEAGIQAVAYNNGAGIALNFPSDSPSKGGPGNDVALSGTGTPGIDDPTSGVAGDYTSVVPQVDMADTFQSTSQFHGTYLGVSYKSLTGAAAGASAGEVGIVPFEFVASSGATFTNISAEEFKSLFGAGRLPKALFTGNTLDETSLVYATGRDNDSGTRATALVDTGYGQLTPVQQFEPLDSTGALVTATGSTIASLVPWPTETVNGVTLTSPNGGYNSGGKLAGALGSVTSSMVVYASGTAAAATGTGGDLVTYLSTGDAGTATGGGAKTLTFNGYTYNLNNLTEGQYGFWSYEHMYYNSTLSSTLKTTVNSIGTLLSTSYATVPLSAMHVTRSGDGGAISNSYAD